MDYSLFMPLLLVEVHPRHERRMLEGDGIKVYREWDRLPPLQWHPLDIFYLEPPSVPQDVWMPGRRTFLPEGCTPQKAKLAASIMAWAHQRPVVLEKRLCLDVVSNYDWEGKPIRSYKPNVASPAFWGQKHHENLRLTLEFFSQHTRYAI